MYQKLHLWYFTLHVLSFKQATLHRRNPSTSPALPPTCSPPSCRLLESSQNRHTHVEKVATHLHRRGTPNWTRARRTKRGRFLWSLSKPPQMARPARFPMVTQQQQQALSTV